MSEKKIDHRRPRSRLDLGGVTNSDLSDNYMQNDLGEERSSLLILDKRGEPIRKVDKQYPHISVLLDVLRKSITGSERVLDVTDDGGIVGLAVAHKLPANVSIEVDSEMKSQQAKFILRNVEENKFSNVKIIGKEHRSLSSEHGSQNFDYIIYNHSWDDTDISILKKIELSQSRLSEKGKLLIVSHKKKGADRLLRSLLKQELDADIINRGRGGVRIIAVEKKTDFFVDGDEQRKIEFGFQDEKFACETAPGVFSGRDLDQGTRFLLDKFLGSFRGEGVHRVADVGCGWGPLSIVVNRFFPGIEIVAFDNNLSAVDSCVKNLKGTNAKCIAADFSDLESRTIRQEAGTFSVVLSHPPYHVTQEERVFMLKNMKKILMKGGSLWMVIENSYAEQFRDIIASEMGVAEEFKSSDGKYFVFVSQK